MNEEECESTGVLYNISIEYRENGHTRIIPGHPTGLELLAKYIPSGVIPQDVMEDLLGVKKITGDGRIYEVIYQIVSGEGEHVMSFREFRRRNYPEIIFLGPPPVYSL